MASVKLATNRVHCVHVREKDSEVNAKRKKNVLPLKPVTQISGMPAVLQTYALESYHGWPPNP